MTVKYGMPYFQNFINSDMKPNQVRSMSCRLQLDLRELLKRGNGLFSGAEMTGSLGVVTLNSARIGFVNKGNKEAFLKRIEHPDVSSKDFFGDKKEGNKQVAGKRVISLHQEDICRT